jgi:hypothetical protein
MEIMEDIGRALELLVGIYGLAKEILIFLFLIRGYRAFTKYLENNQDIKK